jgi:hypothetical protein
VQEKPACPGGFGKAVGSIEPTQFRDTFKRPRSFPRQGVGLSYSLLQLLRHAFDVRQ